jgi:hypothetical protein
MKGHLFQRHHPIPLLESVSCEGAGGHDGVFELYSMSCVPVPQSYFSRCARRAISLSAGGFIQFVGEDEECGVVQARQPVTPADNYIQVHVIESQKESAVAIGVAGRNYALDQMPGWQEGSIAFHLDDGNLFVQAGDPARFGPVCVQGDVVGCRVKFGPDGSPRSMTWTRNGQLIGTKSIHRIPGFSTNSGQLFFSIGLNRPGEKILVSTGTSPDLPSELDESSAQCGARLRATVRAMMWRCGSGGDSDVFRTPIRGRGPRRCSFPPAQGRGAGRLRAAVRPCGFCGAVGVCLHRRSLKNPRNSAAASSSPMPE